MADVSLLSDVLGWFSQSWDFLWTAGKDGQKINSQDIDSQHIRTTKIQLLILSGSAISALILLYLRGKAIFKSKVAKSLANPQKMWERSRGIFTDPKLYGDAFSKLVPVITLANFKGGSGKTTIVANLAAFFDDIGAKVLVIDFDSQGSLTDLISYKDKDTKKTNLAASLLEGKYHYSDIPKAEKLAKPFNATDLYSATSDLEHSENSLLL